MKVYQIYDLWGHEQIDGTVKTVMRLAVEDLYLTKEEARARVDRFIEGRIINFSFVKWQKYVIVEQNLNVVEEVTL